MIVYDNAWEKIKIFFGWGEGVFGISGHDVVMWIDK